jgi:hypothetical protein
MAMAPAFNLDLLPVFARGTILVGQDDELPPEALRRSGNVRLDRRQGAVTPRAGDVDLHGSALSATHLNGHWLSRLFGVSADFSFVQVATGAGESKFFRMAGTWGAETDILTVASAVPATSANITDGFYVPWIYWAGPALRKDNGTTLANVGIAAPAQPPASATLGTRERISINAMDSGSGSWALVNVGGIGHDANVKQEGTGSLTGTVAADTLATLRLGFTGALSHHTGTHDGPANNPSLVDGSENFITAGIKRGARVRNTTDGCEGTITRVAATEVFCDGGLTGGVDNDFDVGDAYEIFFNLDTFQIPVTTGTDDSGVASKLDRTVDTSEDFINTHGVVPGMLLVNTANGCVGTITAIATTTNPNDTLICTGGFSGSSENDFDNADTFTVVNDLVKDDDYLKLQVQVDFPERVEYLQLDWDRDTTTTANAFRTNYYTTHVPGTNLTPGHDTWTELLIPKSQFTKIGTTGDWKAIRCVQIGIQTSVTGGVTFRFDDLSLVGGYGIEGDIEYTAFYRNSTTGARGSPPKITAFDGSETVLFTIAVEAQRHPITLDLSNIDAPSDTQINQICIVRRGGTLTEPRLVLRMSDAVTSFTDKRSDLELVNAEILETDNDVPPSGTTVVIGGAGTNRLFYVSNRNEIFPSKSWQVDENRAENVPTLGAFRAGDGSAEVINGIFEGTTGFIFTEEGTYSVLGQSQDTFYAPRMNGSRGLAAKMGLTSGDGQIFFVATDGIYSMRGQVQVKITSAVDPIFQGQTVYEQAPIDRDLLQNSSLTWMPHPTTPMLLFTYQEDTVLNAFRQLALKRNPQTGQYTEAFFDSRTDYQLPHTYADPTTGRLFAVGNNARIYELETDAQLTDAGTAITMTLQTVASSQPNSQLDKQYESVVVEANTAGESLTTTVLYDRGAAPFALTAVSTTTDTSTALLRTNTTTRRHDIALKLSGVVDTLVKIFRVGWHTRVEPEPLTWHDSGEIALDLIQTGQRLEFEIDAPAAVTVTVYVDNVPKTATTLAATSGHQESVMLLPATGFQGRVFRVTMSSETPFYLYKALLWTVLIKPEALKWIQTDDVTFDRVHFCKRLSVDIDASAVVTATLYRDGVAQAARTIPATSGRQRVMVLLPDSQKARGFYVTLASDTAFRLYHLGLMVSPVGLPDAYQDRTLHQVPASAQDMGHPIYGAAA